MKKSKGVGICIFVLLFIISVCVVIFYLINIIKNQEVLVGFSEKINEQDEYTYISVNEFNEYESNFSKYNNYVYYYKLNKTEKLIYHIYEYALDNSYSSIMIDYRMLPDIDYSLKDILVFLSLDSPIMEQNVKYLVVNDYNFFQSILSAYGVCGMYVNVKCDVFTKEKLEYKQEAIKKANEIIEDIPPHFTIVEKTRWIYQYLGEKVQYKLYEDGEEVNYLYDALCKGVTHCDGFANAFSLLLSLLDVENFEKCYIPEDDGEGHTWNCFNVDGKWYNADATAYKDIKNYNCPIDLFWGYSDELQTNQHLYAELIPACNDILNLDCVVESIDELTVYDIERAYKKNSIAGKEYVLVLFGEPLTEPDKLFQRIADELRFDIKYVNIGDRLFCIFKE